MASALWIGLPGTDRSCTDRRAAQQILERSVAALMGRDERKAFVTWREFADARSGAMGRLRAVGARLHFAARLSAVRAWRDGACAAAQASRRIGGVLSTLGVGGVHAKGSMQLMACNGVCDDVKWVSSQCASSCVTPVATPH